MNAGEIWWGQLGDSLRFLAKVGLHLKECRTTILQIPPAPPWQQDFYEAVDVRRVGTERRLKRVAWDNALEPGAFILAELCPMEVQAYYYPGQSYAQYLASKPELLINDYYVWVTGVHTRIELDKWVRFLSEYSQCVTDAYAVFFIEYDGPITETGSVAQLVYRPEDYYCRVFCLEAASTLANTDLPAYQAELALRLGGGEPEFCAALLETGERLLSDPVSTALTTLETCRNADGYPFHNITESQATSAAWEASIVELFPILERRRMDFIAHHIKELSRRLPISNSIGHQVTEPQDLEVGTLYYLMCQPDSGFTLAEQKEVALYRDIRNTLAHNLLVPVENVRKLLSIR